VAAVDVSEQIKELDQTLRSIEAVLDPDQMRRKLADLEGRIAELDTEIGELRQARFERPVDLDGVHPSHTIREVRGENPQTRPDLEDHVVGRQLGESPDDLEDVLIDQEVLAQILLRRGSRHR